jgi:predicted DNA-binding transcriptional regulator YafY
MSKKESFSRYFLIIKKLQKKPASLAEIFDYLEKESAFKDYDFTISKRTFQRDLDDIKTIFDIFIQYDFSKKVYFIEDRGRQEITDRILEAFDTFNALNLSDRLSNHIHFEKRKPQGTEHLYGLLHAIKNKVQVSFTYQKFWEEELSSRTVEPYALKESKNRWYILANDLKDKQVKTFALDRITDLEISNKRFQIPANFNVNEYFKYSFGIISPNEMKPEEVILSFDPIQGKYIKSLPLHESQLILTDNEEELIIKLNIFLTHDFLMELLSFGDSVKVIKPESLISELKTTVKNVLRLYGDN